MPPATSFSRGHGTLQLEASSCIRPPGQRPNALQPHQRHVRTSNGHTVCQQHMMLIRLRLHERRAEPFTLQLKALSLHLLTWHSFGRLADHLCHHDHRPPNPLLMRPLSASCIFFIEVYGRQTRCTLHSLELEHKPLPPSSFIFRRYMEDASHRHSSIFLGNTRLATCRGNYHEPAFYQLSQVGGIMV